METRVRKNESLEDALRRFKRGFQKMVRLLKFVNVNTTKSQV
ncbi:30S ribosomal protein S21 [Exiguobacterium antarcticum B7]|nr:30S ribosomal protein S21 [Exiguobacterium antarcticum B7]